MNNYFVCILLLPGDKPVILVVLHHTYDPEENVSPQRVDPSQPFMGKVVHLVMRTLKIWGSNSEAFLLI